MSSLRVLYVDDEPDIREVAAISLRLDPGMEVRTVDSGTGAIALIAEGGWTPDVIMLDVMMPGLDGPGALAQLRRMPPTRDTPVVFITARAQTHEKQRFLGLGAVAVITKPFDPMSLAKDLRSILETHALSDDALTAAGAAIAALETRFRARAAGDLAALRDYQSRPTLAAADLRMLVHRLSGAAGTFGHHAVSEAAGRAEDEILSPGGLSPDALRDLISALEPLGAPT